MIVYSCLHLVMATVREHPLSWDNCTIQLATGSTSADIVNRIEG